MSISTRRTWLGLFLLGATMCLHGATNDIPMNKFVIIFRQSPRELGPDELAQRQREVSAWAARENAAGRELEPRILEPQAGNPAEGAGAWPVTALLFLRARDPADAAQVAASHPATRYGASVEVRAWQPPAVARAAPR